MQRHRARRLHYDFRLELDGVLVSWAVPKGPTLDPHVRRAAFHVEDHPVDYFDFEGVIPRGEYGGGDVIVWDVGTWRPAKDRNPARDLRRGELHLDLVGQKLHGRFVLVRTGSADEDKQWLLLHKDDEFAVAGWQPEDHPLSVLTGRTNDEVQADPDRLWRSDLPAAQAAIALKPGVVPGAAADELAALDALGRAGDWSVFGRTLRVTDLDKVLFPPRTARGRPVTKRELLRYSAEIAPVLLPYLTRRRLRLHRFPTGVGGAGSWPRGLPARAPAWLPRAPDPGQSGGQAHLVVDEPAALVWAANFAALEWHVSTSRVDEPQRPTYAVIDLDPETSKSWRDLRVLARLYRTGIEHLGRVGRPVLTGRGGIQIWVPVDAGWDLAETREWVRRLSTAVTEAVPELVRGPPPDAVAATVLVPYSPRPAAGAPVSAPIEWDELDDPRLRSDRWTLRTIGARVAERGDLFRAVLTRV